MIIKTGMMPSKIISNGEIKGNENIENTNSADTRTIPVAANTISNAIPDNRDKVDTIKKQIEEGSYQVDIDKLSEKMAQDLLTG